MHTHTFFGSILLTTIDTNNIHSYNFLYEKAKVNYDMIYCDTSTIKHKDGEITIPRNKWNIMVDERSSYKVLNFYDIESCVVEPIHTQFEKWR